MRRRCLFALLPVVLLVSAGATPQAPQPKQPLEEIVRHFAEKEDEYAGQHSRYSYQLSVRVQELSQDGDVTGEFEQVAAVDYDPSGRRRQRLLGNPRLDLVRLGITRVELEDLNFIPLFILSAEQIPEYDITYLTRERVGEVDTYLFRLQPRLIPRYPQRFFEGIVWVDAEKLDIVKALGRSLPESEGGAFNGYFRRVEIYREPVDDYLFPTYVRADDVLSVRDAVTRARLTVRFSGHQRLPTAPAAPKPES